MTFFWFKRRVMTTFFLVQTMGADDLFFLVHTKDVLIVVVIALWIAIVIVTVSLIVIVLGLEIANLHSFAVDFVLNLLWFLMQIPCGRGTPEEGHSLPSAPQTPPNS